jgi:hypothetical protein
MPASSSDQVHWLFVVGRPTVANIWAWHAAGRRGPNPLASFAAPYGAGKAEPGDTLYLVNVNWPGSRFELLGRVVVRTALPVARDTRDTVLIVAKRGSASRSAPVSLPARTVDRLRFLHNDGTEHQVKRSADGSIKSGQFGGRANLRQLVAGRTALDRELDRNA